MNQHDRLSLFDRFFRLIAWLRIAISPTLLGVIVGFIVYVAVGGAAGLAAAICFALLGIAGGVVWAERVRRNVGTEEFMSRLTVC